MRDVVLLSGGMDSALGLALSVQDCGAENVVAMGFDYGQLHVRELEAAARISGHFGVRFLSVPIRGLDGLLGGSLVTGQGALNGAATVVPGRNPLLLAHAVSYAASQEFERVVIGCNATDRDTYPDCRREALQAGDLFFSLASGIRLHYPLIEMRKAEIVAAGNALGLPWDLTRSCYTDEEEPCEVCGACWERRRAFAHVQLACEVRR